MKWVVAPSALALGYGAWAYPAQAIHAYWWAYQLMLGCSLGALAVLMIHQLVGGRWGTVIRRPLEAAVGVLPWLAVGFLPAALWLPHLITASHPYFSAPFFIGRAIVYFAIWLALGRKWASVSAPGLVIYGITTFFAAVDWIMALEPRWASTAVGLVYAAGQIELGFAVGILAIGSRPVRAQQLNDLGNLLLAATMSWAYVAYAQYLVIWSGNLRADVPWYVHRSNGGWQAVIVAVVVLHFLLPFGLLLFRAAKRDLRPLAAIAAVMAAGQAVHTFWEVTPAVSPTARATWLDLAALALVGAGWLWAFQARQAALPAEEAEEAPEHAY